MGGRLAIAALLLLLTVSGAAGAAPPDTARIVEHVSAAGVKLGAKRSTVFRAWGKPNRCNVIQKSWFSTPGVEFCSWGTPDAFDSQLEVELMRGKVIAIHVRSLKGIEGGFPGWKTTKGIALGATVAAVKRAYGTSLRQALGGVYYLSKQAGETVVETQISFPPSYEPEQVVTRIALYDLNARFLCGTVTGPRWATRPGSDPSERGNRYLVRVDVGFPKHQVKCAFARTWVAKLVRQRPRALYPTSSSSNWLKGPTRPKKYLCGGQTGGRGSEQHPAYLNTGPTAIVGSCYPVSGQSFGWEPDTSRDHDYDGE